MYSLESSRLVPSDEYPCARVSDIFQGPLHYFVLVKLAAINIRVKKSHLSGCVTLLAAGSRFVAVADTLFNYNMDGKMKHCGLLFLEFYQN